MSDDWSFDVDPKESAIRLIWFMTLTFNQSDPILMQSNNPFKSVYWDYIETCMYVVYVNQEFAGKVQAYNLSRALLYVLSNWDRILNVAVTYRLEIWIHF